MCTCETALCPFAPHHWRPLSPLPPYPQIYLSSWGETKTRPSLPSRAGRANATVVHSPLSPGFLSGLWRKKKKEHCNTARAKLRATVRFCILQHSHVGYSRLDQAASYELLPCHFSYSLQVANAATGAACHMLQLQSGIWNKSEIWSEVESAGLGIVYVNKTLILPPPQITIHLSSCFYFYI